MPTSFARRVARALRRAVQESVVARGLLRRRRRTAPAAVVHQLGTNSKTLVVDVDSLLLKSSPPSAATLFPPFFLVAVEAGTFARGLLLLALYPFLRVLTKGACLKAMAMVCFCGLPRDEAARICKALLPRHFLREGSTSPMEVKAAAAVSRSFPTVMVEAFLKEYARFDAVVGREVKATAGGRYFSGVMEDDMADMDLRLTAALDGADGKSARRNPKPMIFHDGRLAFTPTPGLALAMYIYLPLAVVLAVVRMAVFILLPRRATVAAAALAGLRLRVTGA